MERVRYVRTMSLCGAKCIKTHQFGRQSTGKKIRINTRNPAIAVRSTTERMTEISDPAGPFSIRDDAWVAIGSWADVTSLNWSHPWTAKYLKGGVPVHHWPLV